MGCRGPDGNVPGSNGWFAWGVNSPTMDVCLLGFSEFRMVDVHGGHVQYNN